MILGIGYWVWYWVRIGWYWLVLDGTGSAFLLYGAFSMLGRLSLIWFGRFGLAGLVW